MPDLQHKVQDINSLEKLAGNDTCIHRLHPMVKLLAALFYILIVASFDRYSFGRLVPFVFYPAILMALAEIPYPMLLKRMAVALPFCLFAGLSNIVFDRAAMLHVLTVPVSFGLVSFFTILLRTYLCVMAVLILVSTVPFSALAAQLRRLRVPEILVTVFEMTYRYIGTLLLEASSMFTAYTLRNTRTKGIEMRHSGNFIGHLLLKSFDRAERVYNAMKCRGYAVSHSFRESRKYTGTDYAFLGLVCLSCVLFRFVDLQSFITRTIERLL